MSIVLGDFVYGEFMGACCMIVESFDDIRVMETISIDHDGDGIQSVSHVLSVTDLIRGAAHSRNVELVMVPSVVVSAFDVEMGDVIPSATSTKPHVTHRITYDMSVAYRCSAYSFENCLKLYCCDLLF